MKTLTAPDGLQGHPLEFPRPAVFLAGGITGCPDWQEQALDYLADEGFRGTALNPRRANFPIDDPDAAPAQIRWEHEALRAADLILFWFCAETLQPIALYELGAWSMTVKPIVVGAHPEYERRQDVLIQTGLVRPEVEVFSRLTLLLQQVLQYG